MSEQNIIKGFKVASPEPIDNRMVVEYLNQITDPLAVNAIDIDTIYPGLTVYVIATGKFYYFDAYNNRSYRELNSNTVFSSVNPTYTDYKPLGTIWLNTVSKTFFILRESGHAAMWVVLTPQQGNPTRIFDYPTSFRITDLPSVEEKPVNGYLYNKATITINKPFVTGWRVPTSTDIYQLFYNLGATGTSPLPGAGKLKSVLPTDWNVQEPEDTDEFKLSLKGEGYLSPYEFNGIKSVFSGWINDVSTIYDAFSIYEGSDYMSIVRPQVPTGEIINGSPVYTGVIGLPIRLVTTVDPGVNSLFIEGVTYKIVKINGYRGPQWWLDRSLSVTKFADGTDIAKIFYLQYFVDSTVPSLCNYNFTEIKSLYNNKVVSSRADGTMELENNLIERVEELESKENITNNSITNRLVKFNSADSTELINSKIGDDGFNISIDSLNTGTYSKKGYIYNNLVIKNSVSIAPIGWRIPSISDWDTLFLTVNTLYGNNAKSIASKFGWNASNTVGSVGFDSNSNNSSGFSAVSAGIRAPGNFSGKGTQTLMAALDGVTVRTVSLTSGATASSYTSSPGGISIRCVKTDNLVPSSSTVLDASGNKYSWVKIGDQYWLTSNIRATEFQDGTSITNITSTSQWESAVIPAYCSYNNESISPKIVTYSEEGFLEAIVADNEAVSKNEIYNPASLDNVAIPVTVGGIAAGTTAGQLRGKSMSQLWDMLLFPAIEPTITDGYLASIFIGGNIKEVSPVPVNISITVTGNRGSINKPWDGNTSQGPYLGNPTGLVSVPSGSASGSGLNYTVTYSSTIPKGITSYVHTMSFAAGVTPLTSAGNASTTILPASATSKSHTTNMEGVYPIYYTNLQADPAFKTKHTLLSATTTNTILNICAADVNGLPSVWIPIGMFTPTTPEPTFYVPDPVITGAWVVDVNTTYVATESIGAVSYKKYSYNNIVARGATPIKIVF